ncbi:MAG TPA: hypothetical protein VKI65_02025, partial [Gemmataceae bacterium]|nr:hypothetical protein [Gemmataceae bacterium]
PEQWTHLDQVLQERVLASLGGLQHVCVSNVDLLRALARPLIDMAAACLGEILPITDVAQVEVSAVDGRHNQIQARAQKCLECAAPLVTGEAPRKEVAFLLAPAGPAGKAFADAAKEAVPGLQSLRVAGQADLMFCREHGYLTVEDVQRLLRPCRGAYQEAAMVPHLSPHSRFDVTDWVPLNP